MYEAVYITTNSINNKKYIGSFIYERINDWEKYLGSGVDLSKDISRMGREYFSKEIISNHSDEDSLRIAEEELIVELDAVNSSDYYNLKYSAIGGDTFTTNPNKEHTRKLKSENSQGFNNPQLDKEKTDVFKDAIKKSNSRAVLIDGVEYSSMTGAAKAIGISPSTLGHRLDNENYPEYQRLFPKKVISGKRGRGKRPIMIRGTEYASVAEASRATGESTTKISKRTKFDDDYRYI